MAQRRLATRNKEAEWLDLAAERFNLPNGIQRIRYFPDVDLLMILIKENAEPTRTVDDQDKGLILHYEGRQLVSAEVLNLYGVFVS